MSTSTMLDTSEENIITTEENAETAEQSNPIIEQNTSSIPLVEGDTGGALSSSPTEYPANQENTDELSSIPDQPAESEPPSIEPMPDTSINFPRPDFELGTKAVQNISANPEPEPASSPTGPEQTISATTKPTIEEVAAGQSIIAPTSEQFATAPTPEQPPKPADATIELAVQAPSPASPETKVEEKSAPLPSDNTNCVNEPSTPTQANEEAIFLAKLTNNLIIARQKKKQLQADNLEKILSHFSGADKITNNKVEALLKVSDRTAGRYLETLFKQGKIMRFGKNRFIFYQKYG